MSSSDVKSEIILTFFIIPAFFLFAAYIIVGEFLPVNQKRILLATAYVIMLGSLAATAALDEYKLGMVVLFH